jgi:hypothetical protein
VVFLPVQYNWTAILGEFFLGVVAGVHLHEQFAVEGAFADEGPVEEGLVACVGGEVPPPLEEFMSSSESLRFLEPTLSRSEADLLQARCGRACSSSTLSLRFSREKREISRRSPSSDWYGVNPYLDLADLDDIIDIVILK